MPASSPELRRYSIFAGWYWRRLDKTRVRVWNTGTCANCFERATNHEIIVSEQNDASLNLSAVIHSPQDLIERRGSCMHAGGPFLCNQCWELWREGKVDNTLITEAI